MKTFIFVLRLVSKSKSGCVLFSSDSMKASIFYSMFCFSKMIKFFLLLHTFNVSSCMNTWLDFKNKISSQPAQMSQVVKQFFASHWGRERVKCIKLICTLSLLAMSKSLSTGKTFYATNKFKHCHSLKTDATCSDEFSLEGCDILCLGYKNRKKWVSKNSSIWKTQNAQEHLPINNEIRLS